MARCPFFHAPVQQAREAEWQLVSPRAAPLLIDTEIRVGVNEADRRGGVGAQTLGAVEVLG